MSKRLVQLGLDLRLRPAKRTPISKLTQSSGNYYAFAADVTDEDARHWYRHIFGTDPQELVRTGGGVLVGPIPRNGNRGMK